MPTQEQVQNYLKGHAEPLVVAFSGMVAVIGAIILTVVILGALLSYSRLQDVPSAVRAAQDVVGLASTIYGILAAAIKEARGRVSGVGDLTGPALPVLVGIALLVL